MKYFFSGWYIYKKISKWAQKQIIDTVKIKSAKILRAKIYQITVLCPWLSVEESTGGMDKYSLVINAGLVAFLGVLEEIAMVSFLLPIPHHPELGGSGVAEIIV